MKAWIPVIMDFYRGGLAIVLGILLIFIPDKSQDLLMNLMGFFWLSLGLATLRRDKDDELNLGRRTTLAAGLVGILTGLLVVTRRFTEQWVSEEVFFYLLGLVILMTGLMHMFSEERVGGITKSLRTAIQFLLGLLEVLLGGLLLFSQQLDKSWVYWAATAWAIVYGVLFIGTAVYQRRQRKKKSRAEKGSNES